MRNLVDSSIWINFLNGNDTCLDHLLPENAALINEVILMELLPFFHSVKNQKSIDLIMRINRIPLKIDWENLMEMRINTLQNGINKVGILDLIILQQAIQNQIPICTFDKHFKLMQPIFDFELIER